MLAEAAGVGRELQGLAFVSGVLAMADIIAKACSSPQTCEINAASRADTLMKWVKVGMVEGAVIIGIAAWISPQIATAFIFGAVVEAAITYAEYVHAKRAGLKSGLPGTEDSGGSWGARWAA